MTMVEPHRAFVGAESVPAQPEKVSLPANLWAAVCSALNGPATGREELADRIRRLLDDCSLRSRVTMAEAIIYRTAPGYLDAKDELRSLQCQLSDLERLQGEVMPVVIQLLSAGVLAPGSRGIEKGPAWPTPLPPV
ncbi:MAG TPA: hypothetical protein VMT30_00780 [Candidatus Saccharimonadia bacterium]|nr:hypothetical protein [Candidatus Saccharimonadia bacterium]